MHPPAPKSVAHPGSTTRPRPGPDRGHLVGRTVGTSSGEKATYALPPPSTRLREGRPVPGRASDRGQPSGEDPRSVPGEPGTESDRDRAGRPWPGPRITPLCRDQDPVRVTHAEAVEFPPVQVGTADYGPGPDVVRLRRPHPYASGLGPRRGTARPPGSHTTPADTFSWPRPPGRGRSLAEHSGTWGTSGPEPGTAERWKGPRAAAGEAWRSRDRVPSSTGECRTAFGASGPSEGAPGGPLPPGRRSGPHQPRSLHSSKWGRSVPRVVSLPCPG